MKAWRIVNTSKANTMTKSNFEVNGGSDGGGDGRGMGAGGEKAPRGQDLAFGGGGEGRVRGLEDDNGGRDTLGTDQDTHTHRPAEPAGAKLGRVRWLRGAFVLRRRVIRGRGGCNGMALRARLRGAWGRFRCKLGRRERGKRQRNRLLRQRIEYRRGERDESRLDGRKLHENRLRGRDLRSLNQVHPVLLMWRGLQLLRARLHAQRSGCGIAAERLCATVLR